MTAKKFNQLLAMAERLGMTNALELAYFKAKNKLKTNEELLNALFQVILNNEITET